MESESFEADSLDGGTFDGSSPQDLTDAIGQLHGLECAVRRRMLNLIVAYDRREDWKADGATSMVDWASTQLRLPRAQAVQLLEVAHALEGLPAIAIAFEEGRLSWGQIVPLVRIATPETDEGLAERAQGIDATQLEAAARRLRRVPRRKVEDAHDRRFVSWQWSLDHTWLRLQGRLPADQGAVVVSALERIADRVPHHSGDRFNSREERQADALAEMASSSTAADSDPDRATVVVHVDAGSLATNAGPNPEIQDGPNLHFDVARRLACDCRLQVVAHDANGAPLGVGRTTRSVPHWLLRQLKHRDQACRFPGCSRQRFVHAHHIVHWAKGGPTDLDNLLVLCTYHHRLVHEKGWKVRGHPSHAVTFLRPDGSVLATGPPPLRHEIRQRMIPDLAPSGAT